MFDISLSAKLLNLKLIWRRLIGYFLDGAAFALAGVLAFELRFDSCCLRTTSGNGGALCIWVAAKSAASSPARRTAGGGGIPPRKMRRIVLANSADHHKRIGHTLLSAMGIPRSVSSLTGFFPAIDSRSRLVVRYSSLLTDTRGTEATGQDTHLRRGFSGFDTPLELQQNDSLMCDVVGLIDDDPSKARLI